MPFGHPGARYPVGWSQSPKKFNSVTCTITSKTIQDNLANGISPNENNWKIISKLAHRTFVPETEESRIKGAGGSDDAND